MSDVVLLLIKKNFFWNNFIYLYLAVLGLPCCLGFSLIAMSRGYSSCSMRASYCRGFSYCRAWALGCSHGSWAGSRAQDQNLWCRGLVLPRQGSNPGLLHWPHLCLEESKGSKEHHLGTREVPQAFPRYFCIASPGWSPDRYQPTEK